MRNCRHKRSSENRFEIIPFQRKSKFIKEIYIRKGAVSGTEVLQEITVSPETLSCKANFLTKHLLFLGLPRGTSGKETTCQCRRQKRRGFHSWVGKIPWRRARQPTPVILPGESHGQRSLAGYSPWGRKKSWT